MKQQSNALGRFALRTVDLGSPTKDTLPSSSSSTSTSGYPPRLAQLGTSKLALLVACLPIFLTFYFLHQHYEFIKSLRRPVSNLSHHSVSSSSSSFLSGGGGAASAPRPPSRDRALSAASDLFQRRLTDGCDLTAPEAAGASLASHRHVRALGSRNEFGGFLRHDLGVSGGAAAIVGVGGGAFADAFIQTTPTNTTYLVDPWKWTPGVVDVGNVKQEEQEGLLSETLSRLHASIGLYKVVREDTAKAAQGFGDCSLEFVYVDARRDYEGVLADLIDWWAKVKPGGVLAVRAHFLCVCCVCVLWVALVLFSYPRVPFTSDPFTLYYHTTPYRAMISWMASCPRETLA